jgi:hypothetical protein
MSRPFARKNDRRKNEMRWELLIYGRLPGTFLITYQLFHAQPAIAWVYEGRIYECCGLDAMVEVEDAATCGRDGG